MSKPQLISMYKQVIIVRKDFRNELWVRSGNSKLHTLQLWQWKGLVNTDMQGVIDWKGGRWTD